MNNYNKFNINNITFVNAVFFNFYGLQTFLHFWVTWTRMKANFLFLQNNHQLTIRALSFGLRFRVCVQFLFSTFVRKNISWKWVSSTLWGVSSWVSSANGYHQHHGHHGWHRFCIAFCLLHLHCLFAFASYSILDFSSASSLAAASCLLC